MTVFSKDYIKRRGKGENVHRVGSKLALNLMYDTPTATDCPKFYHTPQVDYY